MTYTVLTAGETKKLERPDGRELADLEFGQPSWPLVIHNHGGPSSRLEGTMVSLTISDAMSLACPAGQRAALRHWQQLRTSTQVVCAM